MKHRSRIQSNVSDDSTVRYEKSDISFNGRTICSICIDLPCCGHSRSPICRETCKNILEIGETMQQIIDTLSPGCGPVSFFVSQNIRAELTHKKTLQFSASTPSAFVAMFFVWKSSSDAFIRRWNGSLANQSNWNRFGEASLLPQGLIAQMSSCLLSNILQWLDGNAR